MFNTHDIHCLLHYLADSPLDELKKHFGQTNTTLKLSHTMPIARDFRKVWHGWLSIKSTVEHIGDLNTDGLDFKEEDRAQRSEDCQEILRLVICEKWSVISDKQLW